MEKKVNNDEIDLLELLVKGVLLVKRNLAKIVIFFVVGSALGYTYASFAPKVYESKMIISSSILTESYCKQLAETLNSLVIEKNYQLLSTKLDISIGDAAEIGKLRIESVNEKMPALPPDKDKTSFLIFIELTNEELLSKLQTGIIKYLQDNEFVSIRVAQHKAYYSQITEKITQEIQSLEDFKSNIYNGKFFQSANGNVMFDPTTVNTKIIELNKEKINLQHLLELVNSVQVIEGFTKFDKPIWPKKSISMIAGATFGLFLVGFLIAFKAIRGLVKFAEEHPSTKRES